jgi:hypothetical protein
MYVVNCRSKSPMDFTHYIQSSLCPMAHLCYSRSTVGTMTVAQILSVLHSNSYMCVLRVRNHNKIKNKGQITELSLWAFPTSLKIMKSF